MLLKRFLSLFLVVSLLLCSPLYGEGSKREPSYLITESQLAEWEQSLDELENVRKQLETLSKDSETLSGKYEKSKSWNNKLVGALTVSVGVNIVAIIYWARKQ